MPKDALTLSDYPGEKVIVACRSCDRRGQYDKAALIKRVGPDGLLPLLRWQIMAGLGCELAKERMNGHVRPGFVQCGAMYPDLRAAAEPSEPSGQR